MHITSRLAILLAPLLIVGCSEKVVNTPAPAPETALVVAPAPGPAPAAPAEPTAEQAETAQRQAKLDYATMEDGYINDTRGQWASSSSASSTYGDLIMSLSQASPLWTVPGMAAYA